MPTFVHVAVKIGDVGKSSRTSVAVDDAEFMQDEDANSFDDLGAMIEERAARNLQRYETKTTRPDTPMYLKPSMTTSQKDFVALTPDKYRDKISHARSNFLKRKKVGPFITKIFVFATKHSTGGGTRRATASRVLQAPQPIDQYLVSQPDIQVGEIARTHWAMTHARYP